MSSDGMPSRLRRAREKGKLSRRELSLLAGLAQAAVGIIERNPNATPSSVTMAKLADVLGISLDWLIAGKAPIPTRAVVHAAVTIARARRASSPASATPPVPELASHRKRRVSGIDPDAAPISSRSPAAPRKGRGATRRAPKAA